MNAFVTLDQIPTFAGIVRLRILDLGQDIARLLCKGQFPDWIMPAKTLKGPPDIFLCMMQFLAKQFS